MREMSKFKKLDLFQFWIFELRQTFESFFPWSCGLGQKNLESAENWPQWNSRPQSNWLFDRLYWKSDSISQISAISR